MEKKTTISRNDIDRNSDHKEILFEFVNVGFNKIEIKLIRVYTDISLIFILLKSTLTNSNSPLFVQKNFFKMSLMIP